MYNVLVFVHVFTAVLWIGGVIGMLAILQNTRSHGGVAAADVVAARVERLLKLYVVGPVLVLASGITMVAVSDAWAFSQPWVYLAITTFVIGSAVGGSASGLERRIRAARHAGEVEGADFATLQARYLRFMWVSIAILASVELFMVFRPGI